MTLRNPWIIKLSPAKAAWRAAAVVLAILLLSSCGSSSSSKTTPHDRVPSAPPLSIIKEKEHPKANLVPVHWQVSGSPRDRKVTIYSEEGYCVGEPAPQFKAVQIQERGIRIYITPYIQKGKPPGGAICRGVGSFQRGIVKLGQDVANVKLYDSAASPPIQRWPD